MPESVPGGCDSPRVAQGRRGSGRVDYATAGAAGRAVIFAANRAELTPRQHRVLAAVVAFTALYSRIEERVYLGQLAAFAHGVEKAPHWMLKKTRETLGELENLGLVAKAPPRGRPPAGADGPAYWIALGTPKTDPAPGVISQPERDPAPGVTSVSEKDPAPGPKVTPPPGQKGPRSRAESDPAPGPPTEKVFRGAFREGCRGNTVAHARTRDAVGSLAARLAAVATTNGAVTDREAERVAELLLDFFPPDVAAQLIDDLHDGGEIRRPGTVLTGLECGLDEDQADAVERIHADRRFQALAGGNLAVAIADACGGQWTEHLEEAELVEAHLIEHAPAWVRDEVLDALRTVPLARPGHAERIARQILNDVGVDLPKLKLPPARRIRKRRIPE